MNNKKSAQPQLFAMLTSNFLKTPFLKKLKLGVVEKLQASALRLINEKVYSGIPQGFNLPH